MTLEERREELIDEVQGLVHARLSPMISSDQAVGAAEVVVDCVVATRINEAEANMIEKFEDRIAELETKLDKAMNHSSGQDDQLKVQHGKMGLLEAKLAKAEKKVARLQTDVMKLPPAAADQVVAATPPPPPPGWLPPPSPGSLNQTISDTGTPPPPGTPVRDDSFMFGYAPAPTLPGSCPNCGHPWNQHFQGVPCLQPGCGCLPEHVPPLHGEKSDFGKRAKLVETEAYEMGVEHGRRLPGDGWTLPNGVELHGHAALGEAYARGVEEGERRRR